MTDVEFAMETYRNLIPMYVDSAKTYSELSIGALALTIAFKEKVLGESGRMRKNTVLVTSWLCFLIAIAASAYYQWVAVRLLEHFMKKVIGQGVLSFPLTISWLWPGYAYGVMVCAFFVAAILLVLASTYQFFGDR